MKINNFRNIMPYARLMVVLGALTPTVTTFANDAAVEVAQSQATEVVMRGKVIDNTGMEVIGATVVQQGTTNGTVTDINGSYSIIAPKGSNIEFGFIGYKPVVIKAEQANNKNVTLEEDVITLDDVVVTGYQNIQKGRATGSFDIVDMDKTKAVVSPNILAKLEGNTSGYLVNPDGKVIIRGQSTLYSSSSPLLVVDGFPMEGSVSNINPNDIENITVLKDAASSSIWGVRAANGVIVITTKKAKHNQSLSVSYNANLKVREKTDLHSYGYMNGADQVAFERYAYENGFKNGEFASEKVTDLTHLLNNYSQVGEIYFNQLKGHITPAQAEKQYADLASFDNHQYIKDNFYRAPVYQQHNLTIQTGGKLSTTYLSLMYERDMLGLIGNERDKVGFQLNNNLDIASWFKVSLGLRGNLNNRDMYDGNPFARPAYERFRDDNGNFTTIYKDFSQATKDHYVGLPGYQDWSYNPEKDRDLVETTSTNYNVSANVSFDFYLPFDIKFSTSGMYTIDNAEDNVYWSPESYFVRGAYNLYSNHNTETGKTINHLPTGGVKDFTFGRQVSYTWRNILSYSKSLGRFDIGAQAGTEMFSHNTKINYDRYYGYDPQSLVFYSGMDLKALTIDGVNTFHPALGRQKLSYNPSNSEVDNRYFSTFATADVSLDGKYTVFGSIRKDKTNLYGQSSKYRDQPTWSVGGRWQLSEESFFNVNHIDALSLKGSYGLSGNINKSTSPYLIANPSIDYYTGLRVLGISNPENPLLGWEKVYSTNAGFDLSMFRNRLNVSFEYYNKLTKDALGQSITDPTLGFGSIFTNSASIKNYGFDMTIGGDIVRTRSVIYNTSLNLSLNRNKVVAVNAGAPTTVGIMGNMPIVGQPIDYMWAFEYAGLDRFGDAQFKNAEGEILNQNAYNNIGIDDIKMVGTASPQLYGGWSHNVGWNGFTLDVLLTYQFGSKFRAPSNTSTSGFTAEQKISEYYNNTWRKLGDEYKEGMAPKVQFVDMNNKSHTIFLYGDNRIERGDYIRLKSVGLSYDFKRLIKSNVLKGLNARFSVENVGRWVANSGGWDPENVTYRPTAGSPISYTGDLPTFYTFTLNLTL